MSTHAAFYLLCICIHVFDMLIYIAVCVFDAMVSVVFLCVRVKVCNRRFIGMAPRSPMM